MQNGRVIAAGVAFGYLLGRTKKMKLALMLGAAAMGSRLDMKSLARKGTELVEASPGAKRLASEVAGRLGGSGLAGLSAVAGKGMDALSDNLERRTGRMRSDTSGSDTEAEADEPEEEPEEEEPEDAEDEEPQRPRRRSKSGSGSGSSGGGGRSKAGSSPRKRSSGASKRTTGSRQRRSRTSG